MLATSIAGASSHWRQGAVDVRLGSLMLSGGLAGSAVGVAIFSLLRSLGVVEDAISLLYVIFLGVIGGLMAWESLNALKQGGGDPGRRTRLRSWMRSRPS